MDDVSVGHCGTNNTKRCEKGGIMFAYTKVCSLAAYILYWVAISKEEGVL